MTSHIQRHPDSATLMFFVAGGLAEPLAAATAGHLSMCAICRSEVRDLELIGAALLQAEPCSEASAPVTACGPPPDGSEAPVAGATSYDVQRDALPEPIARRYGITLDTVRWKRLGPGVLHHRLALSPGVEGDLRLLKIAAGARMPEHGHGGGELTLVLHGAYRDETGCYRRGDLQDVGEEIEHRPIADEETGCVCLIASERPARFKGIIGRVLQPWTGM